MNSVKENLVEINSQICNSSEESEFNMAPQVIVVTKYVTIDRAKEAYEAGLKTLEKIVLKDF